MKVARMDPKTDVADAAPEPSLDELRHAHRVASRSRALESQIVRLATRGDVKFAVYGTGEEVHGTATALALHHAVRREAFGIAPHYRSCALISMWTSLGGDDDFARAVLRQQFSRDTDRMSRGRQMVQHLVMPEHGVLPVQSPVGMQLGKAAGYALGFQKKGVDDAVVMSILGDGTTAEGDLHDTMNAVAVWKLPLIILVTDNGIAISTRPNEGRGIQDFARYAEAFGVRPFSCDGRDFFDTYRTTLAAARHARETQTAVLVHAHSLPRFNGHSSAADMTFDVSQPDPLIALGEELVRRGALSPKDVLRRKEGVRSPDFFALHELGAVMDAENEAIREVLAEVRTEPEPPVSSIEAFVHPPFPNVVETVPDGDATHITYGSAIRSALDYILSERGGLMYGQDVARLGGVMQASAGLLERHEGRIFDAPLNEPLILGTAMGAGLHEGIHALPEIQFGDYALNAFHWLVYLGNLYWTSNGHSTSRLILRTPVDPFGGGAVYHSMSLDGYITAIPGLVVTMPSTSWDAYGLLLTASEYDGPVVALEPKALYRQSLGPRFPGEPTDAEGVRELKRKSLRGFIPDLPRDIRVPFGKGVVRRPGRDVTVVSWGRAVWTSLDAARQLEAEGVDAEVIDLRTLVPPDLELVLESVARTGRLVVAAEDRAFSGYVRTIQGHVVERLGGVPSRALGQRNLPGIPQCLSLEEATVLRAEHIVEASRAVLAERGRDADWSWVPSRHRRG
jgi:2-oxoisovalerate dehydrogenase E1 component